jgi:hypothetical protein
VTPKIWLGHLALLVAAVFTGAASYVSFAEQPARLRLDDRALLVQWKTAYKRGFAMQAALAIMGLVLGIVAWRQTSRMVFLIGGVLLLANWPWTIFGMMPTNKDLAATELSEAGPDTRALVVKWGRLHFVRTVLGILSTVAFLVALSAT